MKILVRGVVQGVGFRPQVARIARRLGLKGYVRNLGTFVEIYVEGDGALFLAEFKKNVPPLARIESIELKDEAPSAPYSGFEIAGSGSGYRNYMFPVDTALCGDCISDMTTPGNRRYLYPFTNCVNCGARYSVITDLPYDRERTSMAEFSMCSSCISEYRDDGDRRFDAQTISCPACGPSYTLYDGSGREVRVPDPIASFAERLDAGDICVVKSWGGMHISVVPEKTAEFRRWYGRPTKPFAIMVRDVEAASRLALISREEREMLLSPQRPVVLLEKREDAGGELEAVSPGLGSVGIYLPYSGIHHLLFRLLRHDAVVSTSCNRPGEPMIISNAGAFSLKADCYLLHNRRIVRRVDDSVVRLHGGNAMFIRRSRGYVPDILKVGCSSRILSLGAEMNGRISLTKDGYMFSSQYLGDISRYSSLMTLESTAADFMRMLDVEKVDAVAIDMHPRFSYRRFAAEVAGASGAPVLEVQHHHAHASSLLLDRGAERVVALALDGTGYGTDGSVWGGEVLDTSHGSFRRVASLEEIPLVGGEKAITEPVRLVYAIDCLLGGGLALEYDADIYRRLIPGSVKSSSMGRVLDAIAAYLGVCSRTHYDGEPAMRLERLLAAGRDRFEFTAETIPGGEVRRVAVLPLFEKLFSLKLTTPRDRADAAHSMVRAIVTALTEAGADYACSRGLPIGLTGGVSYNSAIERMVAESAGEGLMLHGRIPNGDNGISAGQGAAANAMIGGVQDV